MKREQLDCQRCKGYCCVICGYVTLSQEDIENIAKFFNLTKDIVVNTFTFQFGEHRAIRKMPESSTGICLFWRAGLCTIYEARPKTCRDYVCFSDDCDDFMYDFKIGLDLMDNLIKREERGMHELEEAVEVIQGLIQNRKNDQNGEIAVERAKKFLSNLGGNEIPVPKALADETPTSV